MSYILAIEYGTSRDDVMTYACSSGDRPSAVGSLTAGSVVVVAGSRTT